MNIDRYYSAQLRPMGRLSKPIKLRKESHLKWIRQRACAVSGVIGDGGLVAAHHVQRKSHVVNDYLTVPLAHHLHSELHTEGVQKFEDTHAVSLEHALIAQLVERIIDLEAQLKG